MLTALLLSRCLGLVRGVWRDLYSFDAELPPAYSRDWAEASGEETLLAAATRHLVSIEAAQARPGDVVVFRLRSGLIAKHAAILATPSTFVHAMEGWVIDTLADLGVESFRRKGRIGIWTTDLDGREAKIGAIGVRLRRWVTMHGFAVNLSPDLSHFGGIVPCGIEEFGVTSLERLGRPVASGEWDRLLLARAPHFLAALDRPCGEEITCEA